MTVVNTELYQITAMYVIDIDTQRLGVLWTYELSIQLNIGGGYTDITKSIIQGGFDITNMVFVKRQAYTSIMLNLNAGDLLRWV